MLVNGRSVFRLGGQNDGLGVMGVVSPWRTPPPVRSPFDFPLHERTGYAQAMRRPGTGG